MSKGRKSCVSNGCVSSKFPNRKTDVRVVIHSGASEAAQNEASSLQESLKNGANVGLGDVTSRACEQQ